MNLGYTVMFMADLLLPPIQNFIFHLREKMGEMRWDRAGKLFVAARL